MPLSQMKEQSIAVTTEAIAQYLGVDKAGLTKEAAGGLSIGVENKSVALGAYATFDLIGSVSYIKLGADGLVAGDELMVSTGGKYVKATVGYYVSAILLENGDTDDIKKAYITAYPLHLNTTTTIPNLTDTPATYGTAGQVLITNGTDAFTYKTIQNYEAIATSGSADADNVDITINATAGAVTVTLPTAASIAGKIYRVKATNVTNAAILDGYSSETIDGSANYTFTFANEAITIVSDGTNWQIMSDHNGYKKAEVDYLAKAITAAKTADYTITSSDFVVILDGTSAAVTATLPTAVGISGKRYKVKCINKDNAVILDGNGSETIDGAANYTFATVLDCVEVVSNGTNWYILSKCLNA